MIISTLLTFPFCFSLRLSQPATQVHLQQQTTLDTKVYFLAISLVYYLWQAEEPSITTENSEHAPILHFRILTKLHEKTLKLAHALFQGRRVMYCKLCLTPPSSSSSQSLGTPEKLFGNVIVHDCVSSTITKRKLEI